MAIIMSEMLTNDIPYSSVMDYIEVSDVLRGIAGYKDVSSQLPQVLGIGLLTFVVLFTFVCLLYRPGLAQVI